MNPDELRQLAQSGELLRLERVIAPRIVTLAYWLGLAAIAVWSLTHFFVSFSYSFGRGLWGLVEIAVFGGFAWAALRLVAETLVVYFKSHEDTALRVSRPYGDPPGREDLHEAIDELAHTMNSTGLGSDDALDTPEDRQPAAYVPVTEIAAETAPSIRKAPLKRTAKRTPARSRPVLTEGASGEDDHS